MAYFCSVSDVMRKPGQIIGEAPEPSNHQTFAAVEPAPI